MRQQNFQSQRGFSLSEMLVVLLLVGLLVGMAIPSFVQARRYANVTTNVNKLFVPLTRARNLAMKKQRPVLIIMQYDAGASTQKLTFSALLDKDYTTGTPGYNGVLAGTDPTTCNLTTCTTVDLRLAPAENPFGSNQQLVISPIYNSGGVVANYNNQFSFGYPTAASVFTAAQSNLTLAPVAPNTGTCAGTTCWFGFDASGKLIPNGVSPFLTQDITGLVSVPGTTVGGPEFYFAEPGAAANTRLTTHVFRKIQITSIGGVRILSWNPRTNQWEGTR